MWFWQEILSTVMQLMNILWLFILVYLIVAPQNTCGGFSQLLSPMSSNVTTPELVRYNEARPPTPHPLPSPPAPPFHFFGGVQSKIFWSLRIW